MLSMRTGCVLALTVALCATAFATDDEARAAIEAANAKFSEAFARGDAKT